MRGHNGKLFFAPTDLSRFLACRRLTSLDRAVKLGETSPPPVFEDPRRDALAEAGQEHEARMLERYRIEGHTIETVDASGGFAEQSERTLDAMRRGREVIYQGKLGRGTWGGYPDFLVRVPRPSALGDWSYEVVDAKLATVAKADAVLQIAVYSWLLEAAQGTAPVEMHLALGGAGDGEPFRVADFAAFERALRRQFEDHCADPGPTYPEPVDLCPRCDWNQVCRDRRRADDHLSLVAGASRHQRRRLEDRGITTLAALGRIALPLDPPLDGVQPASLQRIHRQAKAQLTGRESGRPFRELIAPPEEGPRSAGSPRTFRRRSVLRHREFPADCGRRSRVSLRFRGPGRSLRRPLGFRPRRRAVRSSSPSSWTWWPSGGSGSAISTSTTTGATRRGR